MVLAAEGALASMVSTIPVVVTGGILLKFAEAIQPKRDQVLRRKPRKRKSTYSRSYSGDFSNVGF